MSWLARLKKAEEAHPPLPTEPTKPGFVGSVVTPTGHPQISTDDAEAANDSAPVLDVDLHCWPHSSAMNSSEIDAFMKRVMRFTASGLNLADAEQVADRLVRRDRDHDDRRACLECRHLRGHGRWQCANWRLGRHVRGQSGMPLVGGIVQTLQRCEGYASVMLGDKPAIDFGEMG
jgi:hypothetical protein